MCFVTPAKSQWLKSGARVDATWVGLDAISRLLQSDTDSVQSGKGVKSISA